MDLRERAALILAARDKPKVQAAHIELCRRDPIYWFNTFCWTFDPRVERGLAYLPFNLYPFQEEFVRELIRCIETGEDVCIEKSRDMGMSWLIILAMQWCWLYKAGWDFLVGSIKEKDVCTATDDPSTLFGKLRFNYQRLPIWMKPKKGIQDKKLLMQNLDNNNVLSGEASTTTFGRGPRKRAILLDEFSYWDNQEDIYGGLANTTRCRIVNGTPYGEDSEYYRILHNPHNELYEFSMDIEMKRDRGVISA